MKKSPAIIMSIIPVLILEVGMLPSLSFFFLFLSFSANTSLDVTFFIRVNSHWDLSFMLGSCLQPD